MSSRRLVFAVAVPVLLASCTQKEAPPPVAQQAPMTTVAPTTTTLPPPPPTTAPTPAPVWRDARWGMTAAEVLATFRGEAQKLARPASFAQPQPGATVPPGAGGIAIPAYEADGTTFRVLFGFEKNALNRIHLSSPKPDAGTCAGIEAALTERLAAWPERRSTGSSLKGEEMVWKRPDQTIVLSCAGIASLGFLKVSLDHLAPGTAAAN